MRRMIYNTHLGGSFKHFVFSARKFGDMIPNLKFDEHNFSNGWEKNHQLDIWNYPPCSNSHRQDYSIFSRESQPKPSFVTGILCVGGRLKWYLFQMLFFLPLLSLAFSPHGSSVHGIGCWMSQMHSEVFPLSFWGRRPWMKGTGWTLEAYDVYINN